MFACASIPHPFFSVVLPLVELNNSNFFYRFCALVMESNVVHLNNYASERCFYMWTS